MKKLLTICAVLMMFAISAVAQAATVNVSLEPSIGTVVGVGDTFDLELWFRSSPTVVVVHELNDLGLHWDPVHVSFDGPASTADGAYAWSDAMSFPGGSPSIPMYWDAVAANADYSDGDAELMLAPQFNWAYPGLGLPTTDQHQLTLTFTALAFTDSTSIWLTTSDGVWAENPDAAHVMDCTGDLTGADVKIVPSYACSGFEPPMDKGTVKVKKNRVLPLKAQLLADGQALTDADIIAPPVIQVIFEAGTIAADVTDDALSAGQGTEGNQFEFSDGKWQFNLKTKNYSAVGTYTITMVSGDKCEYVIDPTCTASFVIE